MSRDGSLTQHAYQRLRADLLSCRLPPGEKLNIKELAQGLDVSLGAVREALSRLTSECFVDVDQGRGFRAAPISAADLRDLTHVRVMIEGLCLRRAIEVGDVAWEADVVAAHHRLSRTPQTEADPRRLNDAYAALHRGLHEALTAACDSPWLLRMRSLLYVQSERYRYLAVTLVHGVRDTAGEHKAIVDAALARDANAAVRLLSQHLETTTSILLEVYGIAARGEGEPPSPVKSRSKAAGGVRSVRTRRRSPASGSGS